MQRTQRVEDIKSGASTPRIRDGIIKLGKRLGSYEGNPKVQVELRFASPLIFRADPNELGQKHLMKLLIDISRVEDADLNGEVKLPSSIPISLLIFSVHLAV